MKNILLTFVLGAMMAVSCSNNKSFVVGSWTIDNLNSVDTSVNSETLLATSLAKWYTDSNMLNFSPDHSVTLISAEGKELDKGNFELTDHDSYLIIRFPNDNMESKYQIADKTDKAFKLRSTHNGETINISLTRKDE